MERRNINTVGTIFNDFLGLYTGERPVGIRELIQKYDKHPVLMGLLSNVDSIIYVDVKKAIAWASVVAVSSVASLITIPNGWNRG